MFNSLCKYNVSITKRRWYRNNLGLKLKNTLNNDKEHIGLEERCQKGEDISITNQIYSYYEKGEDISITNQIYPFHFYV